MHVDCRSINFIPYTAEKIFPILWEAVETLELYNIPVVAITSDGAKPNRRFYHLCSTSKSMSVPYKTTNCFRKDTELYFFCDPPHLLKTARNCFSNSFAHSRSRKMQVLSSRQYKNYVYIHNKVNNFYSYRNVDKRSAGSG